MTDDRELLDHLQAENYDLEHALDLTEQELEEAEAILGLIWQTGFRIEADRAAANNYVFERVLDRFQEITARSGLPDEDIVTLTHDAAILGLYMVGPNPRFPDDEDPLDMADDDMADDDLG